MKFRVSISFVIMSLDIVLVLIPPSPKLDDPSDSTPSDQTVISKEVALSNRFLSSEWVLALLEESLPLSFSLWALTS